MSKDAARLLLSLVLCCAVLAGCGLARGETESGEAPDTSPVRVELRPASGSDTRGTAVFEDAGDGVQVELEVSGLPEPGAQYFSQVHAGSCEQREKDGGSGNGLRGSALALIRPDWLVAETPGLFAHGNNEDHDGGLPGNLDARIEVSSSADGTGWATILLEGVTLEEVSTGHPKYLDLHPSLPGDPPLLACGDLGRST